MVITVIHAWEQNPAVAKFDTLSGFSAKPILLFFSLSREKVKSFWKLHGHFLSVSSSSVTDFSFAAV